MRVDKSVNMQKPALLEIMAISFGFEYFLFDNMTKQATMMRS